MRNKKRIFFITKIMGKGVLLLLFSFLLAAIIGFEKQGNQQRLFKEGEIALNDFLAPFGFSYIDAEKTRYYRQESKEKVKDVYNLDPQIKKNIEADINNLFQFISTSPDNKDLVKFSSSSGISLSTLRILSETEKQGDVKNKLLQICSFLLRGGIIDSKLKEKLIDESSFLITVQDLGSSVFRRRLVERFPTVEDIENKIREQSLFYFVDNRKLRVSAEEIVKKNIAPNLVFNKKETEKKRQEAWDSVSEIEKKVKKNQLIVGRGQRITQNHLCQLTEITKKEDSSRFLWTFSGLSLLVLIFCILFQTYIRKLSFSISHFSVSCLLGSVSLLFFLLAKGIIVFSLPALFIPTAFAPMLVAMLLSSPPAIFLAMVLSLFSGLLSSSLNISILCLAGGIVGVYAVEGIKRRAQLVKAGFLVGFVNLLVIISFSLIRKQEFLGLIENGLWVMSQGLLSAFMVMGILPLFEHLFKLTTNISLLELSDLNHPLLKRLIMEAPGTYHHSLIVGNLSESASEAIGANSLLARVASYYHDIGKIEKSEYFSENQKGKNKHNKLVPTMSSLIIIKHVKDGVEMCQKYNLPRQIIEIIKQHHGTSLVPYFYQRALDLEKDKKVNEESFRYPGPKPQTKEAAIVMLADSIEASSRSLDNPSPSRLKGLVEKIINDKFIDHQLDECSLALTDLSKIAKSFSYILNGVFHNRIKYPETNK